MKHIPRQLTAEGAKTYFTRVTQPYAMCQQQFSTVKAIQLILERICFKRYCISIFAMMHSLLPLFVNPLTCTCITIVFFEESV